MQTDWYKTIKLGTYLIVPAGTRLDPTALPQDARHLIEGMPAMTLALDAQCGRLALQFGFLGVEDCVRMAGYCILKSG